MKTKEMVIGAMLAALGLLIPLACGGFLGIVIPPFSATLAAHVPLMLAMTISPWVAVAVALVGAFGFLLKLGAVVAMRALTHTLFAVVGAVLFQKGWSFAKVLIITAPIHAIAEAIIVIPFGFSLYNVGVVIGIGTLLHHSVDSLIALAVYPILKKFLPRQPKKEQQPLMENIA